MANILQVKKYPVHLAIQKSLKYSDEILLKYLEYFDLKNNKNNKI